MPLTAHAAAQGCHDASPRLGEPLVSVVSQFSEPFHYVHQEWSKLLLPRLTSVSQVLPHVGFTIDGISIDLEAAAALLASTMQFRLLWAFKTEKVKCVYEAEAWFSDALPTIADLAPSQAWTLGAKTMIELAERPRFWGVLPHVCEVLQTGAESYGERGVGRVRKRRTGVFFTPHDVATFLADQLANHGESVLDPACGSGILLLATLLASTAKQHRTPSLDDLLTVAGVDLHPQALQSCAYMLAIHVDQATHPAAAIEAIRPRLICADALQLGAEPLIALTESDGFRNIVCNPPYRKQPAQAALRAQPAHKVADRPKSSNICIDFLHLVLDCLSHQDSTASVILPLSISYANDDAFRSVRRRVEGVGGSATYLHFDRTPDSLFGDDVKVRTTILVINKTQSEATIINSSHMMRWASTNRNHMWNGIRTIPIPHAHGDPIPKISETIELDILSKVEAAKLFAGDLFCHPSNDDCDVLYCRETAYNWLTVQLTPSSSGDRVIGIRRPATPAAIYALSQSHLAYWLWRVRGDGFHLSQSFLRQLPLGRCDCDLSELDSLGTDLWGSVRMQPDHKVNAGASVVSYCPFIRLDVIRRIDDFLAKSLGMDSKEVEFLAAFQKQVVVAGRKVSELGSQSHRTIRLLIQS